MDSRHLVGLRDRLLQALALLQDFLAFLLVAPKAGLGYLLFQLLELISFGGRVKDSSAQRQLAGGAARIPAEVRRESRNSV